MGFVVGSAVWGFARAAGGLVVFGCCLRSLGVLVCVCYGKVLCLMCFDAVCFVVFCGSVL